MRQNYRRIEAVPRAGPFHGTSLLSKATQADVVIEPFPHLVLRNVLAPEFCAQLLEETPSIETLAQGRAFGSNQRISYPCHAARANWLVSKTWKRFLNEHVSQTFLDRLMELFGPSLRRLHPRFEERCGRIDRLRGGLRGGDGFDRADILLDAQICANTPVLHKASSVRGAHVDTSDKLFAGLYYLRHPADDSAGGALQLYGPRAGSGLLAWPTSRKRFELRRTIQYEHNVLVLFLNSIDSVHLVTPRSPTRYPRLLVNLVGSVREPLWSYQKRLYDRLRQRILWNSATAMRWTEEEGR